MSDSYSDKERLLRELNESANRNAQARANQTSQEDAEALRALYGQAVHMPQNVGNIDEPVEVDKMSIRDAKSIRSVAGKTQGNASVSIMQKFSTVMIQVMCVFKGAFSPREVRSQCTKTGHQCANCGEKIPYREKY